MRRSLELALYASFPIRSLKRSHAGRCRLQIILAQYEPEPMPVSMLHAGQGILPLKVRSFLDFAAPRLRAAIAAERLNPGREAR
jgi:hypothetical protein